MSLLEDVFLENEAGEAQELERIIEGDEFDERPRSRSDSDENSSKEDEAEEDKRRVDPTSAKPKRVIKNPRFVLNPARLTGPRGIQVVPEHFKDFKFKGKGHEREDLDLVLKKLEHWAYRLYPKFQFEDCLKKIETLGKKRAVAVHLHRIRMDQISSEDTVVQKDSSDDEAPPAQAPEEDEFDKLLQQQIEIARTTPAPGSLKKTPFSDRSSLMPKATSSPSINDEQRERMLKSRRMAEERRLARLNQNITQETPIENTKSPTKIDIVSKESRNNSVLDSSDDDDSRNKNITQINGSKSDIVDVDDMVVTKSPRFYIPAKKHKASIDSQDDCMTESVIIEVDDTNSIVELDNDGKVVTKSPKKHNKSRIDSSDDDDALVINEFDNDKYQNSRAKSSKNLSNKNKSNVDSSDDDLLINESDTADVEKHHKNNARDSRSNIIETSDSEDESIVMNESITVDIHDSNKYVIHECDINVTKDCNKKNSNNDGVFDSLRTTENSSDVIMTDHDDIHNKSKIHGHSINGKKNGVTDSNNAKINDSIILAPNATEISKDNVCERRKSTENTEFRKNGVQNNLVEDVMDLDFSDVF